MRPAFAHIDLAALRHNYQWARQRHGGRALAVLKANAYGHGAVPCARALHEMADGFAVAFVQEAVALREAGICRPILVLEGAFDAEELHEAARLDLWLVVHQEAQLRQIGQIGPGGLPGLHLWIKIDSGMHRAGFAPQQARAVFQRLAGVAGEITWMTHLACADDTGSPATAQQLACFHAAVAGLPGARSISNSAAILAWPQARAHWARPGVLLYGVDPSGRSRPQLRPVMRLCSRVFAERTLLPGEALGYGARFVATSPTRVGLVALGYADGYPRRVPDGTPVAVDGLRTRLVGCVSMDMLTVDLSLLPAAGVGSRVQLWGDLVDVNAVAAAAGTIAYELLCGVQRVPRVHAGATEAGED